MGIPPFYVMKPSYQIAGKQNTGKKADSPKLGESVETVLFWASAMVLY